MDAPRGRGGFRGGRGRGGRGGGRGRGGGPSVPRQEVPVPRTPINPIIDIGANLTSRQFASDLPQVLARAKEASVYPIIVTGTSLHESRNALALARLNSGFIYATAGVHPHNAKDFTQATLDALKQLLSLQEVVAVGECGLDFDRNFSPPAAQEAAFEQQLRLAVATHKPLFLHERAAFTRFHAMMEPYKGKVNACVHCFTGTGAELRAYVEQGWYIGITGWVCDEKRGKELQKIVSSIPLDRLMIETDAPFLAPWGIPASFGRRCEPCHLPYVLQKLAECTGRSYDELATATRANTLRFFGLQPAALVAPVAAPPPSAAAKPAAAP